MSSFSEYKSCLFEKAVSLNENFPSYDDTEKFQMLMSNGDIVPKPAVIFS